MTNAVKGAVLSAVVFPGLGQIALGRYRRGVGLILASLAALVVMVVEGTRRAVRIFETIGSSGSVIDQDAIARAIAQSTAASDSLVFNLFLVAMTACWLYSAVDAYRIGKQQDLRRA